MHYQAFRDYHIYTLVRTVDLSNILYLGIPGQFGELFLFLYQNITFYMASDGVWQSSKSEALCGGFCVVFKYKFTASFVFNLAVYKVIK